MLHIPPTKTLILCRIWSGDPVQVYAQSTREGAHLGETNHAPTTREILIHYLEHSTIEDLEKFVENEVEWAGPGRN